MSAYYNENDQQAAEWLRHLIKAGAIAEGDVDERDIRDVRPDDVLGFTQCHFFAGIGVWSYSLRQAGWEDGRKVWTGSCPCQPFSAAGRREGFTDERHLWPAFFHLIRVCRPAVVFGEQVASKDGLEWFDTVASDLEGEAYRVAAFDLCAAGVGAPHLRNRLYFVADGESVGNAEVRGLGMRGRASRSALAVEAGGLAHSGGPRPSRDGLQQVHGRGARGKPDDRLAGPGAAGELGDSGLAGLQEQSGDGGVLRGEGSAHPGEALERAGTATGGMAESEHAVGRPLDVDGKDGCHGQDGGRAEAHRLARARSEVRGLADTELSGSARFAALGGEAEGTAGGLRDAAPGHGGAGDRAHALNGFWRDADWLLCRDGKWRAVEPGAQPLASGIAGRVGLLRGYGNALCAPVAQAFIESYLEENQQTK